MGRVAPEARAVCGSYNPAAANLSHTVHTFRFSMPLPGDTHAYELTHLRYMLHGTTMQRRLCSIRAALHLPNLSTQ
mgnify:CR=1 FL=1